LRGGRARLLREARAEFFGALGDAAPFEFRHQCAVPDHQGTLRREIVYRVTHDCSRKAPFTIILRRAFARGLVKYSSMLTAHIIKNQHSDIFTFLHGDLEIEASHCHVPQEALLGGLPADSSDA
jgi:hypothetical protein